MPCELDNQALDRIEAVLVQDLTPASPQQIALQIEVLRARYGEWAKPLPAVMDALNREWIADLAEVPGRLLTEACRRWRTADDPPHKRPPQSAGELVAMIRDDWAALRHMGYQLLAARNVLAGGSGLRRLKKPDTQAAEGE